MKKFVFSVIYSLILTLLSVAEVFLLQAPLLSFIYYGFFSSTNSAFFVTNIINKIVNADSITIVIMAVQTILTLIFAFLLFFFIKKVINVFLKNEKLVRPYYVTFFFMTLIVPIILIFLSIFFKVKLAILTFVIEGIFTILNTVLIIFARKILPETTNQEYRKYPFEQGYSNE